MVTTKPTAQLVHEGSSMQTSARIVYLEGRKFFTTGNFSVVFRSLRLQISKNGKKNFLGFLFYKLFWHFEKLGENWRRHKFCSLSWMENYLWMFCCCWYQFDGAMLLVRCEACLQHSTFAFSGFFRKATEWGRDENCLINVRRDNLWPRQDQFCCRSVFLRTRRAWLNMGQRIVTDDSHRL